jgi:hypothetical protein
MQDALFIIDSWLIVDLQCISGRTAECRKISVWGAFGAMYPANIARPPRRCSVANGSTETSGFASLSDSPFFNNDVDADPKAHYCLQHELTFLHPHDRDYHDHLLRRVVWRPCAIKYRGAFFRRPRRKRTGPFALCSSPCPLRFLNLTESIVDDIDHRQLGNRLDLFHQQDEGPGMVFWHPRGWELYRVVEDYIRRRMRGAGFREVRTPQLLARSLWERSGHWDKFQAGMYSVNGIRMRPTKPASLIA